jgi:hypothetical protein
VRCFNVDAVSHIGFDRWIKPSHDITFWHKKSAPCRRAFFRRALYAQINRQTSDCLAIGRK